MLQILVREGAGTPDEPPADLCRGGEIVKLGTLNVGTLRNRELEATKLGTRFSRSRIAENIRSSTASMLRSVGPGSFDRLRQHPG